MFLLSQMRLLTSIQNLILMKATLSLERPNLIKENKFTCLKNQKQVFSVTVTNSIKTFVVVVSYFSTFFSPLSLHPMHMHAAAHTSWSGRSGAPSHPTTCGDFLLSSSDSISVLVIFFLPAALILNDQPIHPRSAGDECAGVSELTR